MSNVFSFCGNCGRDAEIKYLPTGQAVLTVAVANTVGFGDKQKTIWVRVTLWGQRGEKLSPFLKKGQQVFVSGEMSLNEYTANDGTHKTTVELNANTIDLVGKKYSNSQPAPQSQPMPTYQAAPAQQSGAAYQAAQNGNYQPQPQEGYDDDIPF